MHKYIVFVAASLIGCSSGTEEAPPGTGDLAEGSRLPEALRKQQVPAVPL